MGLIQLFPQSMPCKQCLIIARWENSILCRVKYNTYRMVSELLQLLFKPPRDALNLWLSA